MKNCKITLTILLLFVAFHIQAQTTNYKAYSVFLYSFSKYVEWPDDAPQGDFVIAVLGSSKIIPELLADVATRKTGNRAIKVVEAKNTGELAGAHMIFIPDQKSSAVDEVVASLKGKPVLIVTERDGLVKKGACISFVKTDDNLLKFEFNDAGIKEQRLKVASALSVLAMRK